MQSKLNLKDKKVIVVGLARSGLHAAILLKNLGSKVFVSDIKDDASTRKNREKLKKYKVDVELGKHSEDLFKNADLIVISPGVRSDALCLKWARSKNTSIISEIELAYQCCPAPIIAVTGTCGKSTTTALIAKILEYGDKKVHTCGNIGNPFSKEVESILKDDIVCLEVSSFQLEAIVNFKPKVAVVLNFSRNHLDRHKDLDEYIRIKKRIFMNQDKNDFAVLNKDDSKVMALASETNAEIKFFASSLNINGFELNANQSAALSVGKVFDMKEDASLEALRNFDGLAHRLELADIIGGVDFINDSKATTVDSVAWALKNIYKPVILIAGGRDKGADFAAIKDLVRAKVKILILMGEAKDKLKDIYKGVIPIIEIDSLQKAVETAHDLACEGDCVLLSPMCASFDMFKDYEERGNIFKQAVRKLKNQNLK